MIDRRSSTNRKVSKKLEIVEPKIRELSFQFHFLSSFGFSFRAADRSFSNCTALIIFNCETTKLRHAVLMHNVCPGVPATPPQHECLRAAVLTKVSRRERFNDVLLVEVSIKRSPLLLENVGMPQSVLSLPSGLS